MCSIHSESDLNYCSTSNAEGKYKPQVKEKYALHCVSLRGMDCLHITSYLYIFLGIDLCHTAQRNYLGGFSISKRGWLSKRTSKNKEPVQSGHWAPFESLTDWLLTKWDNAGPRKKMTTKVLYWSVQHILKVNLSCPNKGFSSNQRGRKPQSQECSTHSWLSHLLTLHPAFETSPKLIDKIGLFPVLSISWEWKVNSFLGNKSFF